MSFNILEWLAAPKSPRTRDAASYGCLGSLVFTVPLCVLVLAFSAIPHCKTCGDQTGRAILLAILLGGVFGAVTGLSAALVKPVLSQTAGRGLANATIVLATLLASYFLLSPALNVITG